MGGRLQDTRAVVRFGWSWSICADRSADGVGAIVFRGLGRCILGVRSSERTRSKKQEIAKAFMIGTLPSRQHRSIFLSEHNTQQHHRRSTCGVGMRECTHSEMKDPKTRFAGQLSSPAQLHFLAPRPMKSRLLRHCVLDWWFMALQDNITHQNALL